MNEAGVVGVCVQDMKYMTEARTTLVYDMPLAEVVTDFFDQLKSMSAGYASMDYTITGDPPPPCHVTVPCVVNTCSSPNKLSKLSFKVQDLLR